MDQVTEKFQKCFLFEAERGKGPIAKKGFNHLPLSPLIKYLKGLFWSERKKCNCSDGSKASLAEKKLTGLGSALIKDRKGVFLKHLFLVSHINIL